MGCISIRYLNPSEYRAKAVFSASNRGPALALFRAAGRADPQVPEQVTGEMKLYPFMYCTSPDESIDLATSDNKRQWAEMFFSLAGQDEHFQQTGGKIGQLSKAFYNTQTCSKENQLHRSCPRQSRGRCLALSQEKHKLSITETLAMTQRRTSLPTPCTEVLNLIAFVTGYRGPSHAQSHQPIETFLRLPEEQVLLKILCFPVRFTH